MKQTLPLLLLALIIFPLCFWAASCEANTKVECNENKILLDSLRNQVTAWQNIVSLNHTNIERLNYSLQDMAAEIEARDEQISKYRNRLDSAAAIIKRQEKQLANSIYNKIK